MNALLRSRTAGTAVGDLADTVLALAVLLQSGLNPDRAWRYLAESHDAFAERVVVALGAGCSIPEAIRRAGSAPRSGVQTGYRSRRRSGKDARSGLGEGGSSDVGGRVTGCEELAQAWQIATEVGAPLADSLRGLAEALRDAQSTQDEIRVALAEPAGTARLMSWLPAVAVLLGIALGFNSLQVLVSSPLGWVCVVSGFALMFLATRWTGALVRRARQGSQVPGMRADLVAIALSGGTSISRATQLIATVTGSATDPATDAVLELSQRAGVPAIELLRSSARLARHRARVQGRLLAAALASKLLIPLGVCTRPAFLLLGVAPMVLSVFATGVIAL